MEIRGREYGFLFSVGAEQELARICPGEDLRRVREILAGRTAEAIGNQMEMLCILSRWFEKAKALENPSHEPQPLTPEILQLLPTKDFSALQQEAAQCMLRDQGQTVEAEPEKKERAPRSS